MPYDDDIRDTIDRCLVALYENARSSDYAQPMTTSRVATEVNIPVALATKIADFLEREGFVDHDDQAMDLTVEGILRAETVLRNRREGRKA